MDFVAPFLNWTISPAAYVLMFATGLAIAFWPASAFPKLRWWWVKHQPWGITWSFRDIILVGSDASGLRINGFRVRGYNHTGRTLRNVSGYVENAIGTRLNFVRNLGENGRHSTGVVPDINPHSEFDFMVYFDGPDAGSCEWSLDRAWPAWTTFKVAIEGGLKKQRVFSGEEVRDIVARKCVDIINNRHASSLQQYELFLLEHARRNAD